MIRPSLPFQFFLVTAAGSITGCILGDCFGYDGARGLNGSSLPVLEVIMLRSKLTWHLDVVSWLQAGLIQFVKAQILTVCMCFAARHQIGKIPSFGSLQIPANRQQALFVNGGHCWRSPSPYSSRCDTSDHQEGDLPSPTAGCSHASPVCCRELMQPQRPPLPAALS